MVGSAPRGDVTLEVLLCHVRPLLGLSCCFDGQNGPAASPTSVTLRTYRAGVIEPCEYQLRFPRAHVCCGGRFKRPQLARVEIRIKWKASGGTEGAGGRGRGYPELLKTPRGQLGLRCTCEAAAVSARLDEKKCGFKSQSARHGKPPH